MKTAGEIVGSTDAKGEGIVSKKAAALLRALFTS